MGTSYSIEKTMPTVYLDARNNAVQGFLVFVHLEAYDELHEIRVPSLDPKVVQTAVNKLVEARDALANLGKSK
jgi:hypothetical protein